MDLQAQKAIIIEQFKQLDDEKLILKIKNLLESALKKKQIEYDIPKSHKDLVMERFDEVRKDPDRLLDWDDVKKTLDGE